MVSGDNVTVTLTGGSPWGFRLTGGGSLPLQIAKIRKKSQAHAQGLQEGDAVVSINGTPVHDRSHDEAVDLIDAAGDTLTLQIYRGDADDLGQLLASSKPHAPLLPPSPQAKDGETLVTSSSSVTQEGGTRREVQQKVFVTSDGNKESTTFVRREHTVTTSTSGDVNGNDTGSGGHGLKIQVSTSVDSSSSSFATAAVPGPVMSLSPKPPAVAPKPSSPKPAVSPKPVSPLPFAPVEQTVTFTSHPVSSQPPPPRMDPGWVPRPTFKAVPPPAKVAPSVAPKPAMGPTPGAAAAAAPKPPGLARPTFNAKAAAAAPMFSPQKFQASATAMYTQQPHPPPPPQPSGGQFMMQAKFQQQAFSPPSGGSGGPLYPSPRQTHLSQNNNQFSPGGQQSFSPMNLSSPISPLSQPFSPHSPSSGSAAAPMFNVRKNVAEAPSTQVWQPNMWMPGQEPDAGAAHPAQYASAAGPPQQQLLQQQQQQQQQPPESTNQNVEVPKRMTIKERQQMLLNQTARTHHSLQARQADPNFDAPSEEEQRMQQTQRMKVFGPPVEMTVEGPCDEHDDFEEQLSPSSLLRKKKMYADSAFYEDPTHKYPTIEEQMRLCRLISNSLTSAANRRARGAKMFAKRKRKSSKWVHEGHTEWSSSGGGDVANIEDLESELDPEEGGSKQLFLFRIPNLKHRVGSPERSTKMSLKKDEFERLRLQAQKCDHRTVSPGTCFDIAADLKAHKGRGGRLFERRRNRADKFIIDESNAKVPLAKPTHLDNLVGNAPLKSSKSPWEAAQQGSMDSAFEHLNNMERMQKMNQILKYSPPAAKPALQPSREVLLPANQPKGPRSDLRTTSTLPLLKGRNFNRFAKGWCASGADFPDTGSMASQQAAPLQHQQHAQDYPVEAAAQRGGGAGHGGRAVHFGDYNPRPKQWQPAESSSCPPSMSASWASSDFDSMYHPQQTHPGAAAHHALYAHDELPASDL